MIDIVRALLEASPLLALFLAIATGYAIGQISFAGVSFGAGAVLFTGLVIGAIAPKSAPPGLVGTLGLLMFVYGVGIQYGPQFFASLRGPGIKYIVLANVAVIASLVVALLLAEPLGVSRAIAAGLFAGSGTSTPTLQAALAAAGNQDPAIGYSVAYPFGVVGPIILMTIMAALVKPKFDPPPQNVRLAELTLESNCRGPDRRRALRDVAGRRQDRRGSSASRECAAGRRDTIAGGRRAAVGRQPDEHRAGQGIHGAGGAGAPEP